VTNHDLDFLTLVELDVTNDEFDLAKWEFKVTMGEFHLEMVWMALFVLSVSLLLELYFLSLHHDEYQVEWI
jgi:hypothetical protein